MSYGVGAPGARRSPRRPGILLGRRALGAIALEPRRWSGGGTARTAIVFGWISVLETAFVVTLGLARGFVGASLGLTVGLVGLVLVALSEALPLRALREGVDPGG